MAKAPTIIASGTEVNGSMTVNGSIRIEGVVRGNVTATESLEVGETGRIVDATAIQAKSAVIHGRVEGNLLAPQHVTLGGKATLIGDLRTGSLVVEEGAIFQGLSAMLEGEKKRVTE